MTTNRNVSTSKSGFMSALIATVAIFAIMGFVGCSSDSPIDSGQTTVPDINDRVDIFRLVDPDKGGSDDEIFMASTRGGLRILEPVIFEDNDTALVGPVGGELSVTLDGDETEFAIPENAVNQLVEITVLATKIVFNGQEGFTYDCGPDGQSFDTPLILTQPMDKPDGYKAAMFYYNETTGLWELKQVSPVVNGQAEFEIHHFSKYGIS